MHTTVNENILMTEKLKKEDPEQFYTLVKMHLSFVLDLNADDCDGNCERKGKSIKWNLPFIKKQKPNIKSSLEGPHLSMEFIGQMKPIIEFLSKEENISQEGIFRRSGRVTRQQELKVLLYQNTPIDFNENQYSVHECATVLKNVLSELPESVLTDAHYPAYCQIAEFCNGKNSVNSERLLRSIQLLILLLPNENHRFFQEIIELLHLAFKHEDKNRMTAENLATLFTPHLLCPRKLSPEALHTNSQIMSSVVAFMIQKGAELFEIPLTVATDVRAYWNKKEKRNLSPVKQMNESICDSTAANTVFTFVDREKTEEENRLNPTETALAQLYAYIQSLPESSKKRKLIKQFNKENGYGTPLRTVGSKKRVKALNLGDSIKKHLSGLSRTGKKIGNQGIGNGDEENSSPDSDLKRTLGLRDDVKICKETPNKLVSKENALDINEKNCKKALTSHSGKNTFVVLKETYKFSQLNKYTEALHGQTEVTNNSNDGSVSSSQSMTKSAGERLTQFSLKRSSSSSFKGISPTKSPRISDKEIGPHDSTNKNEGNSVSTPTDTSNNSSITNLRDCVLEINEKNREVYTLKEESNCNLYKAKENIVNRFPSDSFMDVNLGGFIRASVHKVNSSNISRVINNDGFLTPSNVTNRLPISFISKSPFILTTSTPAPGSSCLLTPIVDKNNSMSPITQSAKRMPKAMQETMMTPRSRKPVISLSGTDLCSLINSDSQETNDISPRNINKESNNSSRKLNNSNEEANDSLSSTFRNYLFTRSVLTASPMDLSFSSRTDDFLSFSEKNSLEDNENFESLPEMLNEAALSESLLYCLDGNEPDVDSAKKESGYKLENCSFSDYDDNVRPVYETAL